MREHKINSQYDFIQGYYIQDDKITDDLIQHFEQSNSKVPGMVNKNEVKKTSKDSTDVQIHIQEIIVQ